MLPFEILNIGGLHIKCPAHHVHAPVDVCVGQFQPINSRYSSAKLVAVGLELLMKVCVVDACTLLMTFPAKILNGKL